jgi:hypothetical protein
MIFDLFSSGKMREFARVLAQDIARRYPTAIANSPDQIVSLQRTAEILDEAFVHAHQFGRRHQTGLLGKARLGRTFKRELREIGYDEAFVELAAAKLARKLTHGA